MTQPETPEAPPTPESPPAPSVGDKGPDGLPLDQMTAEQQVSYWKHYARKHEDTVKAFKGMTPQQVAEIQAKNEELEAKSLSADEKALKAVRDEAFKQARAQAEAEYLPQLRAAKVHAIASTIVSGDKLNAFMEIVDPTKLLGEDGTVDESRVMGYLTAMYGEADQQPTTGQRWQNFGQYAPPPPPQRSGAGGTAEAQKRFGKKS